jgi:serine/threonine protein kinase
VLDFGIAKLASETIGRTTGAMGSPLWMAPEEAKKEVLTPAVDVWSFGLLAFYVLTGRELWRSTEKDATIAQALNEVLLEPIPSPILRAHALGATLPRGFDAWFAGCVVRDVPLRFQSIGDAWGQLERILLALPEPSPVSAPEPAASPPPLSDSAKKWLVAAGSVAFVTVVFGVVVASMGGGREEAAGAGSAPPPSSAPATEDSVLFAPLPVASAPPVVDAGDVVLAAVTACLVRNDLRCAHAALEPAASGKTASAYNVQLFYDLCELEVDRACMARVAKEHPKVDRRKQRERTLSVPGFSEADASISDQGQRLKATDPPAFRALVESRVFGLKASRGEASALWDVCHAEKDRECCATIDTLYPRLQHKSP